MIEHGFDPRAHGGREHGRDAAARDRDQQRRAVDDRRQDEARTRAVVGDVDRNARRAGGLRDRLVGGFVVGRGEHDACPGNVPRLEFARMPGELAALRLLGDLRAGSRCDDGDGRAGGAQQRKLARGHAAAADDERRRRLQVEEDGQVAHVQRPAPIWCRPHSRCRPKNRVPSASSPTSASERVVCQSPTET